MINQTSRYSLIYRVILLSFTLLSGAIVYAQNLITYPVSGGYQYSAHNDDFTVLVREKGTSKWKDLFEYKVEVDMDTRSIASMVSFDFKGSVEVMVRKNNGMIQEAVIRPLNLNIHPKVSDDVLYFDLNKPCTISVEINRDRLHNLHLFANPILTNIPDASQPGVMYFGPGIHKPDEKTPGEFKIPSNTKVYLDGGAILEGKLVVDHQKNISIIGHGIVMRPERGVEIKFSDNIKVEGLIFINPKHYTIYGGQSSSLEIKNIKSFSSNGWSDGIDMMSCSDVTIDGVFMRNSDDCIAIYGHRWDFYGNAKNYKITNSVLWADIAHPTNIGLHGNAEIKGDTIASIHFKNIDILEHDEDDRNYQGCLAITCGDANHVTDITYENIRIESIQEGQIFNFRAVYNEKYSHAPGNTVSNITLKNISYSGILPNPAIIKGYAANRTIKNVVVDNLKINGKKITRFEPSIIEIGEFTESIKFEK